MTRGAPLLVLLLTATALAGCLGGDTVKVVEAPGTVSLALPLRVVPVGFDSFEAAELLVRVTQPVHPFLGIRLYTSGVIDREPLHYDVRYEVVAPPAGFAEELFAYAASTAVTESYAHGGWLATYDRSPQGLGLCPAANPSPYPVATPLDPAQPDCEVDAWDAQAVDAWLTANAARFGLAFDDGGYTLFVLDTHAAGRNAERYHYWAMDDRTADRSVRTMRAWGGEGDHVFLDVGAAPSSYDVRPWANFSRAAADLVNLRDGPVWEYAQDRGPFYDNLARHVSDAARMLWARLPLYPVEYAEHYVLPMIVFVDPRAQANPASPLARIHLAELEAKTEVDTIARAFQDLAPWATVDVTVEFRYLPDDDPDLAQVLEDAKRRTDPTRRVSVTNPASPSVRETVDFGIVKRYMRAHWDEYVPDVPGARVYPTFAFWLEVPSAGIYAYSDGDEVGSSWGVFVNVQDSFLCNPASYGKPLCGVEDVFPSPDSWWRWWNAVLVHEVGHSFGLTHPHDTVSHDADGYPTYDLNWLWDSTSSVMTYRHTLPSFNRFDREWLLRHQAANLAVPLLEERDEATRALARLAIGHLHEGRYAEALEAAANAAERAPPGTYRGLTLGGSGDSVERRLAIPVAAAPTGVPVPGYGRVGLPADSTMLHRGSVEVPDFGSADGVLFEFQEDDVASWGRVGVASVTAWSAWLAVENAAGDLVASATNNGSDRVVLLNMERCRDGCTATVYAYSGAANAYTVRMTPLVGVSYGR